jgi:hypothetical protein
VATSGVASSFDVVICARNRDWEDGIDAWAGKTLSDWGAHDISFRQSEAQAELIAACMPCRRELGRSICLWRSPASRKRAEGNCGSVTCRRRADHGHPLRDQRITVYDKNGWILRAPVSSGQRGRETPAGVFSVIQKDAEHYSNLYDDAYMPHMQRLTWSGIALHGGPLPGHPASHGCVRMPYDFAEHLFGATSLGMRVIVAPSDVVPVEVIHPALFPRKSDADAVAAARTAEAEEAANKADQARLAAVTASREAARAMMPVRVAENLKLRAETQLVAAERAIASAGSISAKELADENKAKAAATVAELRGPIGRR